MVVDLVVLVLMAELVRGWCWWLYLITYRTILLQSLKVIPVVVVVVVV